jgi:hypothetical protein
MTIENRDESFTALTMTAADCIRRAWAGEAMVEQADADLAALDAEIAKAGHDSAELTRAAYEWAQQTYGTPEQPNGAQV